MATPIVVPFIAADTHEGILSDWLVGVGEAVERGQPVAELDSMKVLIAIEAPSAGIVESLVASKGDEVKVGTVIAWLRETAS